MYNGLVIPPERIYDDLFRNHNLEINYPSKIIDYILDELFGGIYIGISFDDYKLRSLSCNGNVLGDETFSILRNHRDNYNPNNTGHFPIYEHFPLLYLTLHDPDYGIMTIEDNIYNVDQVINESLLNSAPFCGPASNGVYEWSSTSRCVWPENLGQNTHENIEYSGLDYMMLHNLYYIAFRKEDYKKLDIGLLSIYRLLSASAGIINADHSILGNNISYTASNMIALRPGFSVSSGKNFTARIAARPNNYKGSLYRTISAFDCKSDSKSASDNTALSTDQNINTVFFKPTKNKKQSKSIKKLNKTTLRDNPVEEISISIYPNPNKGLLNISYNNIWLYRIVLCQCFR